MKKFLVVFVLLVSFIVNDAALSSERKPDSEGRYLLTVPKKFKNDFPREVLVWGDSCSSLKMRNIRFVGNEKFEFTRGNVDVFCFPPVNNILSYLQDGEVMLGRLGFKKGPFLLSNPNSYGETYVNEAKRTSREYFEEFIGPIPQDVFWVNFGKKTGGYIAVQGVVECPNDVLDADFCMFIDNYASVSTPRKNDVYGIYCWESCQHLKSPEAFKKAILFGMDSAELVLTEGYAQPVWRLRRDYIDKVLFFKGVK